ncbi:porin [Rhodoblastus acidophilus]|nr:porin [Rhodoblastus acidophilus]
MAASLGVSGLCAPAAAEKLDPVKRQIAALKKRNAELARRIDALQKRQPLLPAVADAGKSPQEAFLPGGPIKWRGMTLFGAIDAGVAWQSHGVPLNGAYPQGLQYGVSKNGDHAGFHLAPGGMGYSGVGLKGVEPIAPGVSAVFAAYANFNPLSGQLSNGPASLVQNNGVPLAAQSANGDSRAAGQAFNDYTYVGLSSQRFGELTFGRQRTLTTNDRSAYDPIAGSLAFSLLGYSSVLSSGDSKNSRFDEALKYRIQLGPARFAAIYKFAPSAAGAGANHGATYQLSTGADFGSLSFSAVYSHVSGAVSLSSLSAAQLLIYPSHTLAATISDNQAVLLSAKYTFDRFKFFAGYEYYVFSDPSDPILAPFFDYNGYFVSVAANNVFQYHDKIQQLIWTGLKVAYDSRLNLSLGYYHLWQNAYGQVHCSFSRNNAVVKNAATCAGAEDALGAVAEYHFNRNFELYGGLMVSAVTGGMANGFLYPNSVDPMVGLRYVF